MSGSGGVTFDTVEFRPINFGQYVLRVLHWFKFLCELVKYHWIDYIGLRIHQIC